MMQQKPLSYLLGSGGRESGQAANTSIPQPQPSLEGLKAEGGARGGGVGRAAGAKALR